VIFDLHERGDTKNGALFFQVPRPWACLCGNANGNSVTLQATGTGFPAINNIAWLDVVLSYGMSTNVVDFVDTGSGQTFAEMAGVSPLNFAMASSQRAEIRDTNFATPSLTPSAVPESSTYGLLVLAGLFGPAVWFHRRRQTGSATPALLQLATGADKTA